MPESAFYVAPWAVETARTSDAAFASLVHRLEPMIRAMLRRYYLPGGDACDLRSAALEGLRKAVRDFREDAKSGFVSFAKVCIERQVITEVKSANRGKHSPVVGSVRFEQPVGGDGEGLVVGDVLRGPGGALGGDPHAAAVQREDMGEAARFLRDCLSPLERNVLVYVGVHHLSYEQVARRLKVDEKTVDNALQRAREKAARFRRAAVAPRAPVQRPPEVVTLPAGPAPVRPRPRPVSPTSLPESCMVEAVVPDQQEEPMVEMSEAEPVAASVEVGDHWFDRVLAEARTKLEGIDGRGERLRAALAELDVERVRLQAVVSALSGDVPAAGRDVAADVFTSPGAATVRHPDETDPFPGDLARPKAKSEPKPAPAAKPAMNAAYVMEAKLPKDEFASRLSDGIRSMGKPMIMSEVMVALGVAKTPALSQKLGDGLRDGEKLGLLRRTGVTRRPPENGTAGRASIEYEAVENAAARTATPLRKPTLDEVRDKAIGKHPKTFGIVTMAAEFKWDAATTQTHVEALVEDGTLGLAPGGIVYLPPRAAAAVPDTGPKVNGAAPKRGLVEGIGQRSNLTTNKNVLNMIRKVEDQGCTVKKANNGHLVVVFPDGRQQIPIASTPNSAGFKDDRAKLRRAGLTL